MTTRLAAIDFIAACLQVRPQADDSSALRRKINAEEVPWSQVLCLANRHLIAPTLFAALDARGLGDCLPADVGAYLKELYRLNLQRNLQLGSELSEVVAALNGINVQPVLLKGAVSLVEPLYAQPGARIMTDLDLLVPAERIDACRQRLEAEGYYSDHKHVDWPPDHHHIAPLRRKGGYAVVELHHLLVQGLKTGKLFGTRLSNEEVRGLTARLLAEAEPVDRHGVQLRLPGPEFRILHLVLHSALLDREHREGATPLRALHECSILIANFDNQLNWDLIRAALADERKVKILNDWLYLAHRLFDCPLPEHVRGLRHVRLHFHRCRLQARFGVATSFRGLLGLTPQGPWDPRMQCASID